MTKVSLDNRVVKILNHIQAGVLYCKNDPYFTILYANDYFYQMIGYEKDEFALLYSNRFADLVPNGISKTPETGSLNRTEESPLDFEYRMRSKDGKIFWVRDTSWYEKEHDCWYVTIMDITDTKNTAYERQRLEFYLNNMPNKIVICDRNASIIYKNKQAEQCPYYEKDADSLFQLVEGHTLIRQPEEILEQASRGKIQEYETRYEKDGIFIGHDKNRMVPIWNAEGEIVNYMQISEDFLDKSDGLTHFPTRSMFEYYFSYYTRFHPERQVFFLILDVDDFKQINDTYGHCTGDEIIQNTGRRLTSVLGRQDYVCRFGGDEFLVLFVDQSLETVIEKGNYILSTGSRLIRKEKRTLTVTYSIGIAAREGEEGYQELLEKADSALYHVKENGKGGIGVFGENDVF